MERSGIQVDETFLMQAAALFWVLVCFFRVGAMANGLCMSRTRWFEIAQIAAIGVFLFGLLTDWRGLRHYPADPLSQNFLAVHPIQYGLGNGQRGANLTARYTANAGLRNAAILGNLRVHTLVSSKALQQAVVN